MHDDSLKFVSYILIVNILMIVIESEKPCWEIAIKYVCTYYSLQVTLVNRGTLLY